MSTNQYLGVTTGELGRLGSELRASGEEVGGQAGKIAEGIFGPAKAGHKYSAEGTKIQEGLSALRQRITDWSGATGATADVIGASVVAYQKTDDQNSSDMDNQ
ncbi:MAG TPA: hypothetical protein VK083_16160 [Nocardia sp.]|uniref:hypothetical protein n=1 Tax=Nocardia TaxID=1817 RepID=UPI00245409CD|nr:MULTISPECIES: hypothetical protein [Nocardia]HLS78317.1 hypothetical protein [Nocardia sp.]